MNARCKHDDKNLLGFHYPDIVNDGELIANKLTVICCSLKRVKDFSSNEKGIICRDLKEDGVVFFNRTVHLRDSCKN